MEGTGKHTISMKLGQGDVEYVSIYAAVWRGMGCLAIKTMAMVKRTLEPGT